MVSLLAAVGGGRRRGDLRSTALLLAAAALLLAGMGAYPLLDNNEGLYAAIGWDTLVHGDWVVPRIAGLPYLEKPPLLYWLLAASFGAFGKTSFAARLVPAGAALCQVAMLLALGRMNGPVARRAALVLVTSAGFYIMGRVVMFDMLFAALLNAALIAYFLASDRRDVRWQRASYLALALAVLAKGLAALALYGGIALAWTLLRPAAERPAAWRRIGDIPGLAILIAVAAPWHVLASRAEPGFAWFYLVNEHALRYLGLRRPFDYHSGSLLYYVPRLLVMLAPWTFFLPLLARRVDGGRAPLERFFALAAAVELVFFSISRAKANYYAVVMLVPLAWLLAAAMRRCESGEGRRWLAVAAAAQALLPLSALAVFGSGLIPSVTLERHAGLVVGVLVSGTLFALALRREKPSLFVAAAAAAAGCTLFTLAPAVIRTAARNSSQPVTEAIRTLGGDRRLFIYRDFEQFSSLAFYLDRPWRVVDSSSADLLYAQNSGRRPETFPAFADLARARGRGLILVEESLRKEFDARAAAAALTVRAIRDFDNGLCLYAF